MCGYGGLGLGLTALLMVIVSAVVRNTFTPLWPSLTYLITNNSNTVKVVFYVLFPISIGLLCVGQILWFRLFMAKRVPTIFVWIAPAVALAGSIILWTSGPGHVVGASLILGAEALMVIVIWAYESYLRGMFCARRLRYCMAYYLGRAIVFFLMVPIGVVVIVGAVVGGNLFSASEWLLVVCIWAFWIIAFKVPVVTNREEIAESSA